MRDIVFFSAAGMVISALTIQSSFAEEQPLRVGIVGCDTSHVIAFTNLINDPAATGSLAKVEVTVAYPGGSPDLPVSRDRLQGFVAQLREKGVKIVDSLDELADNADAILLESVDGRVHLEQFRAVAKSKPVFVDKPVAASLADALAIFAHADKTHTPVFTSSALRFWSSVRDLASQKRAGNVIDCETVGPMPIEAHHPDLFWYGIHGVEPLFTIMGPGCVSVARTDSDLSAVVVGKWDDGRVGTYRGLKQGNAHYAFTAFGLDGITHRSDAGDYKPLMEAICDFFISGKPPVNREESIEIYAFMEAADESKRQGGKPVAIAEVIQRAEKSAVNASTSATSGPPAR